MVYSDKVFVRWKHVATVIPSLKYFYVYSHHCASVSNQHSCNYLATNSKFSKCENKSVSLIPVFLKSEVTETANERLCQRPTFKSHGFYQNLCLSKQLLLTKHEAVSRPKKLDSFSSQNNLLMSKNNKLIENIFLGDSLQLPINSLMPYNQHFISSKLSQARNNCNEKQPADDPKQKIRVLSEKVRVEAPMFLGKTKPYHDFSIYSNSVQLYVETTPKKERFLTSGLRWYKMAAGLYRRFLRFRMLNPEVEVLSIRVSDENDTIEVRWRVAGWARTDLLIACMTQAPANQIYVDYVSTLYVNEDGLIWRHKISKMKTLQNSVPLKQKLRNLNHNTMGAINAMKSQASLHSEQSAHNFR